MLMDLHAWDPARIKPRDWLENFNEAERPFALQMLRRFVFFPDHLTDELLRAAFHQVSASIAHGKMFRDGLQSWQIFCSNAILTYVTGEVPRPTDSGQLFARKARQALGFDEREIVPPNDAVQLLLDGSRKVVIFVDDFVGSGNQFCETWNRKIECSDGLYRSFANLSSTGKIIGAFYCNAVGTKKGHSKILNRCPNVHIFSGNLLNDDASFVDVASTQWPEPIKAASQGFIKGLQKRYGFVSENQGEEDWRGFHALGLGLAFAHSTPDATLPIFRSNRKGWRPLVMRS